MSRTPGKFDPDGAFSAGSDQTTAVTGFLHEPGKWSQGSAGLAKKAGSSLRRNNGSGGGFTKGFDSKSAVSKLSEGLKDISHHFSKKRSVTGKARKGLAKKGKNADGLPSARPVSTTLPALNNGKSAGANGNAGAGNGHSEAANGNGKAVDFEVHPQDPESTLVPTLGGSSEEESDVDPEVANIKTSKDVIDYYIRHGHNAQIKLFHCNTMPQGDNFNPYQLQVVDRQKVNTEHFTISSSGVVHVQSATHAEFTPLGEWIREQSIFNLLTQMKFFKYYIVNKMFKSWWSKVRHTLYRQVRERLKMKLFLAKPTF